MIDAWFDTQPARAVRRLDAALARTPLRSLPVDDRNYEDDLYLAAVYKRLGELYEARGNRPKTASNYAKFVGLWKDADPELQPKVREARARLVRLSDTERK